MNGFVGNFLQFDDLASQPGPIGGDQHPALGVLDTVGQRLFAEAAIDHGMRSADLGAGQHGDGQFGDAPHVDRHPISLLHAQAAQNISELVDFLPESEITIGSLISGFSLPDHGDFVASPGCDVPVQGVMNDVGLGSDEPFVERSVGVIQHFLPRLEPVQRLGSFRPECFGVGDGAGINFIVIFDVCCAYDRFRGLVDFVFSGNDVLCPIHA